VKPLRKDKAFSLKPRPADLRSLGIVFEWADKGEDLRHPAVWDEEVDGTMRDVAAQAGHRFGGKLLVGGFPASKAIRFTADEEGLLAGIRKLHSRASDFGGSTEWLILISDPVLLRSAQDLLQQLGPYTEVRVAAPEVARS
jgi:hypothetical protein